MIQLAIDFGSTSTYVCLLDKGRQRLVSFQNEEGESQEAYPTLVAAPVADATGTLRFGFDARDRLSDPAWEVRRDLKRRLIGEKLEEQLTLGGQAHPLLDVLTRFFIALDEALRTRSSLTPKQRAADFQVAFAVPARAHNTWRFLTGEALRGAGFKLSLTLDEPSASALDQLDRGSKRAEELLVYDLGGGTCDLSCLRSEGGQVTLAASRGRWDIGGADFDRILAELALPEGAWGQLSVASKARLLELSREQKETLTSNRRKLWLEVGECLSDAECEAIGLDKTKPQEVLVQELYAQIEPILEESFQLFDELPLSPLESGRARPIYIVGGGGALPLVARLLRARFGRRVQRVTSPKGSVAYGLAAATARAADEAPPEKEKLGHYFGVFRDWDAGRSASFDPLFSPESLLDGTQEVKRRYRPRHHLGQLRFLDCDRFEEGTPEGQLRHLDPFSISYQADATSPSAEGLFADGEAPLVEERYLLRSDGEISVVIEDLERGVLLASGSAAPRS